MKMWQKLKESFWEIEQVNLARQKFHELDQRTQNIVIGSSLGSVLAIALFLIGFFIYNCYSIRSEIQTAENTIQYLKQTSAKMDDLRRQIREQSSDPLTRDIDASLPLAQMVEKIAQKSAIGKGAVEVAPLPAPSVNEFAVDLKLNKISLRQLTRCLFILENSRLGISVDKFELSAREDKEGYLWATLSLRKKNGKGT